MSPSIDSCTQFILNIARNTTDNVWVIYTYHSKNPITYIVIYINLFTSTTFLSHISRFSTCNLSFFSSNRVLFRPRACGNLCRSATNTGRLLVTRRHSRHVIRLKLHRACNYRASVASQQLITSAVGSGHPVHYLLVTAAGSRLCRRVYNHPDRIDPRFSCFPSYARSVIGGLQAEPFAWAKYEKDTHLDIDWNIGRKIRSWAIASRSQAN